MTGDEAAPPPSFPSHQDRLARGALLLQGAQIVRLVAGLVVITVLVRSLTKEEYGVYAILLSFTVYVQFIKSALMNAAVVGIAEADPATNRLNVVVSTAFVTYAAVGIASALVLAGAGFAALQVVNLPADLVGSAYISIIGLAVIVALGWPLQIFDDLLRGLQRFAPVSALEILATVVYVVGVVVLVLAHAPVWALVTYNASIPLVTGLACVCAVPWLGIDLSVSRRHVERSEVRRFAGISGYVLAGGVADLATYSLDRVILSANLGPRSVTFYEAPLQVQSIIRFLNGVLTAPIVPAARRFLADGDRYRVRELCLRGLRYNLVIVLPVVVVAVVLAGPIVTLWFGESLGSMSTKTAVFTSWWFLGVNGGIATTMLAAANKFGTIAKVAWLAGAVNLSIALILTPIVGIWGPILASMMSFLISTVVQVPMALKAADVPWPSVLREAWLPAYSTAAALAVTLVGVRLVVDVHGFVPVCLVSGLAVLLYWAAFLTFWASPDERALARRTLRLSR